MRWDFFLCGGILKYHRQKNLMEYQEYFDKYSTSAERANMVAQICQ